MTLDEFHVKVRMVMEREREAVARFFEAADKHAIVARKGRVVVYVEDDPSQISLLKTVFSKYSRLRVEPATTAEQGKRLISSRTERIKCVVLDIGLAEGSTAGLDLLHWIKQEHPTIPVIVLTCYEELGPSIRSRYPDVEFHVKASEPMESLMRAIENSVGTPVHA